MIGGGYGSASVIYDVTDPLHPRLVCTINFTTAHLVTGDTFAYLKPVSANETELILHSLGSGNESKTGSFPHTLSDPVRGDIEDSAWTPDGGLLAYTVTDENALKVTVWLYSGGQTKAVHTYGQPIGDCICRFGLPGAVLSFSPDLQYLANGWVAGKGSTGITVIRLADGTTALTADTQFTNAIWDRGTGHELFLAGSFSSATEAWTPEAGLKPLPGGAWQFVQGISPDATGATYTAYADPNTSLQPRVYAYDLKAETGHLVVDKPRAESIFVKDVWLWYDEEKACTAADQCPGSTTPTGAFFAMQLSTGVEQAVTFAAGENPSPGLLQGIWNFGGPAEYWPAT